MKRALAAAVLFFAVVSAPAAGGDRLRVELGGTPLGLIGAGGSLWALTCDRRCGRTGARSVGRLLRIDTRSGRVVASRVLARPGAIAVGRVGLYVTDFWRSAVRRFDPRTLRPGGALRLRLPFSITPPPRRTDAFLPLDVAVGGRAVWIASDRGALARADAGLRRLVAMVRLPRDAFGGIAAGPAGVWLGESLLGIYRIGAGTNRVEARIAVGPAGGRLVPAELLAAGRRLLAIGAWTPLTKPVRNALAVLDPARDRVEAIVPLPPGPLAGAYGDGSLWVGPVGGRVLERIDPRDGRVLRRNRARVGVALAVAGGHVWTASKDGLIRRLAAP